MPYRRWNPGCPCCVSNHLIANEGLYTSVNDITRVPLCESTIGYLNWSQWQLKTINVTINGALGIHSYLNGTFSLPLTGVDGNVFYFGKIINNSGNTSTLQVLYTSCAALKSNIRTATCPYDVDTLAWPNFGYIFQEWTGAPYAYKYFISSCNNVQSSGWNNPNKLVVGNCAYGTYYDGSSISLALPSTLNNIMMTWV